MNNPNEKVKIVFQFVKRKACEVSDRGVASIYARTPVRTAEI